MIELVLANFLESQGIGTVGTNIFTNRLPENPDEAVAIFEYSGRAPVMILSGDIVIEQPSVQVLVRTKSFAESESLIYQIRDLITDLCNINLDNLYILGILPLGTPAVLERDNENRIIMFCNFDTTFHYSRPIIQVSEQANISYPVQVFNGRERAYGKYASLDGSTVLDTTYILAPTSEYADKYEMGWWAQQLSDEMGYFTSPYPTLTLTFPARSVGIIKVVGDLQRDEWPVDFEIRLYDSNDNILYTETIVDNTNTVFEKRLVNSISKVSKAELVIIRWNKSNRQAKIVEFFA